MAVKAAVKGKGSNARSSKSTSMTARKTKSSSSTSNKISRRAPAKQLKTKPGSHNPASAASAAGAASKRKKHRTYTDAELNLPALNTIVPASAASAPRGSGKKKNKIYVDDRESMMTIMAMVNAKQEGQIESQIMRMRQMEEIREAKRLEAERREEEKRERLETVKKGLKKRGKIGGRGDEWQSQAHVGTRNDGKKAGKKNVSFA